MKNYTITVNGNVFDVTVEEGRAIGSVPVAAPVAPVLAPQAAPAPVAAPKAAAPAPVASPKAEAPAGTQGTITVNSPMPGKIVAIKAEVGKAVKRGEPILLLEAMKMENEIVSPEDGIIASINVAAGDAVDAGVLLATLN